MTHDPIDRPDDALPDRLRWELRAMRRPQAPDRDLWPGLASRLGPQASPRPVRRARWLAPAAMAASLLLVAGLFLGGQFPGGPLPGSQPSDTQAPAPPLAAMTPETAFQLEAAGLARQYQAAFAQMGELPEDPALQPVIRELDRNADLILDALAHQPDSRLLLEQLQRTYARRLAVSQRMLNT